MEHIDNIKKKYLDKQTFRKPEVFTEPKAPFIWKNKNNIQKCLLLRGTLVRWYEDILSRAIYAKYIKWYTLTISPLGKTTDITEHQYILALRRLQIKCKTIIDIAYIYETSEHGKLHIHGIIATRDKTKFLKVKKDLRLHWQMDPLTYLDGWINYMLTDTPQSIYTGYP